MNECWLKLEPESGDAATPKGHSTAKLFLKLLNLYKVFRFVELPVLKFV